MNELELNGEDAGAGLVALVVAVIELLVETMEREAIRRMKSGQLSEEQIERVGAQFAAIESEMERLKDDVDITNTVDDFRAQLDDVVNDLVRPADVDGNAHGTPTVFDDE